MKGLCLGPVLCVGPDRILVVEQRQFESHIHGHTLWLFGERRPHAILVCTGREVRGLDPAGNPLDLSTLLAGQPALAAELQPFLPPGATGE